MVNGLCGFNPHPVQLGRVSLGDAPEFAAVTFPIFREPAPRTNERACCNNHMVRLLQPLLRFEESSHLHASEHPILYDFTCGLDAPCSQVAESVAII